MPGLLGKRKSRPTEEPDSAIDAQEILRRHFEARFKPIAVAPCAAPKTAPKKTTADQDSEDDDDSEADAGQSESEWDGVSDDDDNGDEDEEDDDTPVVEVVDHTTTASDAAIAKMSKRELKAYLSSRPPSHTHAPTSAAQTTNSKKTSSEDQPEDSAAFLANDLALQRLIAESHILSAAGGNSSHWQSQHAASTAANTRTFAAGRTARKTTDMRVQALGAKGSILAQDKMPMAMRKGIVGAAAAKESKRRREARENGIILEREVKKAKTKKQGRGERPVDLPGVGRMRGAELRVSAREASAIAASVRGRDGKGKGKRRR